MVISHSASHSVANETPAEPVWLYQTPPPLSPPMPGHPAVPRLVQTAVGFPMAVAAPPITVGFPVSVAPAGTLPHQEPAGFPLPGTGAAAPVVSYLPAPVAPVGVTPFPGILPPLPSAGPSPLGPPAPCLMLVSPSPPWVLWLFLQVLPHTIPPQHSSLFLQDLHNPLSQSQHGNWDSTHSHTMQFKH